MQITDNQRPGVYSTYTISQTYGAPRSRQLAGLVAEGAPELAGKVLSLSSYAQGVDALGDGEENRLLLACLKILFQRGVSGVEVSVVDGDYPSALALLSGRDNLGVLVCGGEERADLEALKKSVEESSRNGRERVAFGAIASPERALEAASALNSERVALCCPAVTAEDITHPLLGAAALAGLVLAGNDPAQNWNGGELEGISTCEALPEERIQQLLPGGVTVLEERGEAVRCIRPVTTRTRTGEVPDRSMAGLNTILIIDDVITSIRSALAYRLGGGRIGGTTLDSVASQVTVELAGKQDEGLIEEFDAPAVRADTADPTLCLVELSFRVAHVVSRIHITAHIRV